MNFLSCSYLSLPHIPCTHTMRHVPTAALVPAHPTVTLCLTRGMKCLPLLTRLFVFWARNSERPPFPMIWPLHGWYPLVISPTMQSLSCKSSSHKEISGQRAEETDDFIPKNTNTEQSTCRRCKANVFWNPCRVTSQIVGGLSTHEQSCSISPQGTRLRLQILPRGSNSSSPQHSGLTISSNEEAFKGRHNFPLSLSS